MERHREDLTLPLQAAIAALSAELRTFREQSMKEFEYTRALENKVSALLSDVENGEKNTERLQKDLTSLWDEFRACQQKSRTEKISELKSVNDKSDKKFEWNIWTIVGLIIAAVAILVPAIISLIDLFIKWQSKG